MDQKEKYRMTVTLGPEYKALVEKYSRAEKRAPANWVAYLVERHIDDQEKLLAKTQKP